MLDGEFSPTAFQQFARRWRTLDLPYQTAFPDLHSRAWLQAGWMQPNARVVERVVAGRSEDEIEGEGSERRGHLANDSLIVAVESPTGETEAVECLLEALKRIDQSVRKRIVVVVVDSKAAESEVAATDVLVTQPFRDLRSKAALTALANGVPIIGSRYMEHADVMHVGVTGLEVAELDSKSLAKALAELLPDLDRRKEMGRQSKAWLASRASCQWIESQWQAILEEAAELGMDQRDDSGRRDLAGEAGRDAVVELKGILTTSPNDRS